jgi:hypothetical protein
VTQTSDSVTWLTQAAYDQLKAELEHLSGPARAEIVAKIEEARQEGDLKENAGYHAAREDQGKLELRIRQLNRHPGRGLGVSWLLPLPIRRSPNGTCGPRASGRPR